MTAQCLLVKLIIQSFVFALQGASNTDNVNETAEIKTDIPSAKGAESQSSEPPKTQKKKKTKCSKCKINVGVIGKYYFHFILANRS